MKKLGKLTINPEKVIKNEELVNLRGGDHDGTGGCCICYVGGPLVGQLTEADCLVDCYDFHPNNPGYYWEC